MTTPRLPGTEIPAVGATVSVSGESIRIDRTRGTVSVSSDHNRSESYPLPVTVVPVSDIVGVHVTLPNLVRPGIVQLTSDTDTPQFSAIRAMRDPWTVTFTFAQLTDLYRYIVELSGILVHRDIPIENIAELMELYQDTQILSPSAEPHASSSDVISPEVTSSERIDVPRASLTAADMTVRPSRRDDTVGTATPDSVGKEEGHDPEVQRSEESKFRDQRSTSSVSPAGPSFVAFDVETANENVGSICSMGLSIVHHGVIVDRYSWLCQPPETMNRFMDFNIGIHGITPEMVESAPTVADRLGALQEVAGDLPLVAHNARFDMSAIREAARESGVRIREREFGDTLLWSRTELPDLVNHKLPTVAGALDVDLEHHHDASDDAYAAGEIANRLIARREVTSIEDFNRLLKLTSGLVSSDMYRNPRKQGRSSGGNNFHSSRWKKVSEPSVIPEPRKDADIAHPLYGKVVVLTGEFGDHGKAELWERLAYIGAQPARSVTRKTDVLVVGDWLGADGSPVMTGKQRKALDLKKAGQDIWILPFDELLRVLEPSD